MMQPNNQIDKDCDDPHNVKPPKVPERPLTPYMRFSRKLWPKIRQENPESAIWEISKTIKQLWQDTPESEKSVYQHEANMERIEYEKILKAYHNSAAYQQYLVARTRVKPNEKSSSNSSRSKGGSSNTDVNNVTGIVIQPVDEEDPFEMTIKRLASIRYDRNNRLMAELFAPNYLPDSRTIVPQQRVEQLEKQRLALAKHQQKLNDDLNEIEEAFNHRKRSIEDSATAFESELKRLREERPEPSEERYRSLVDEWEGVVLKSYEEYEKRQAAIRARLEAERREVPVLYSLTCGKSPSPQLKDDAAKQSQSNGTADSTNAKADGDDSKDAATPSNTTPATPKENGTVAVLNSSVTTAAAESTTMDVDDSAGATTTTQTAAIN